MVERKIRIQEVIPGSNPGADQSYRVFYGVYHGQLDKCWIGIYDPTFTERPMFVFSLGRGIALGQPPN